MHLANVIVFSNYFILQYNFSLIAFLYFVFTQFKFLFQTAKSTTLFEYNRLKRLKAILREMNTEMKKCKAAEQNTNQNSSGINVQSCGVHIHALLESTMDIDNENKNTQINTNQNSSGVNV
jgi:hypothetical protein